MAGRRTEGWCEVALRARRIHGFTRIMRRFERDEGGAIAVLFGILIAVTLLIAAVAIDHSRFTGEAMQDSQALDAGLLAAGGVYRATKDEAAAEAQAKSVYLANRPDGTKADVTEINPVDATKEISGTTSFGWKATLLRAFGYEEKTLRSAAKVKFGEGNAEVVLVIDNSSFVSDQIEVFRSSSQSFKTEIMGTSVGNGVKMGVVPFAGAVNVGPEYRTASWIDQNAGVGFHRENYKTYLGNGTWRAATETRFDLFDRIGEPWAGCAESRAGVYEGSDIAPDPDAPESLFVPMFAPDEPDPGRNKSAPATQQAYYNDYLEDYPQADCPKEACIKETKRGTCLEYKLPSFTPEQWQQVSCKYALGRTPNKSTVVLGTKGKNGAAVSLTSGPNFGCSSVKLRPLTRDPSEVGQTLDAMTASGGSNIAEGIAWGLRVLSPQEPFTGGGDFNDDGFQKYMIVLARGANWIEAYNDDLNHSIYTPWGYGIKDRLNPQSHTQQSLTNAMDEKTRSACRAAADKGVEVYTIGYQVSDPQMRAMLQYCAVNPKMYLEASTPEELLDQMRTIASKISRLHLTQ